jgi:predicted ferric reductase
VILGIEIYIIHDYTFIISLLFTVHDKIIMLIGTWITTQENSATTRVVWDALG